MKKRGTKKAVAIRYDPDDAAPRVVALGKGEIAQKIIEIAREKEVPIMEKPEIVEQLIDLQLNQEIPSELYELIAEVLAFIYRLNEKMK